MIRGASSFGLVFALLTSLALGACNRGDPGEGKALSERTAEVAKIIPAQDAISGAEVRKLDPSTMRSSEIRNSLDAGARCEFKYSSWGDPVLALRMGQNGAAPSRGVLKLNGKLVMLDPLPSTSGFEKGIELRADPVRVILSGISASGIVLRPGLGVQDADLLFEIGQELKVGYRGYLRCVSDGPG